MKVLCPAAELELGPGFAIDDDVLLGYPSGREGVAARLVIGAGARLRSGSVLYHGSRYGDGLETGHHVVLREEVEAGASLAVWSGSTVDYGCAIGARVRELHSKVYVAQFSVLEDDVFLAPGATLANDLYPGREYSKRRMRGPRILRGAQVGANATVLPYRTIGAGALIGAGSVVTRDVPDGAIVCGNPARVVGRVADLSEEALERRARGEPGPAAE